MVQDPNLPFDVRRDFKELASTYADLKSYAEEPRGTYDSFRAKALELKDRSVHLVKGLELGLGIVEDD